MKILSKILLDTYYELGARKTVPLMMQWDSEGFESVAVSRSEGDFFVITEPPPVSKTAVFKINRGNEDIFERFIGSLLVKAEDIHKSPDEAIKYLTDMELKPRWIIGPAKGIREKHGHLLKKDFQVLNYPLKNRILVVPDCLELGCFVVLSRKDIEEAYASYIVKNPLERIRFVAWNNS